MPCMRKKLSECPSRDCEAGQPSILTYEERQVPPEVRERLAARGISHIDLRRCAYCGVAWAKA